VTPRCAGLVGGGRRGTVVRPPRAGPGARHAHRVPRLAGGQRRSGLTQLDMERGLELALPGGEFGPDVLLRAGGPIGGGRRRPPVIVDVKPARRRSAGGRRGPPQLACTSWPRRWARSVTSGGPDPADPNDPGTVPVARGCCPGRPGRGRPAKERTAGAHRGRRAAWRRRCTTPPGNRGGGVHRPAERRLRALRVRTSCPVSDDGRGVPSG